MGGEPELAAHRFEVYEVGLHHLAFNTETHEQVDQAYELVKRLGGEILDGPAGFPYRGPDGYLQRPVRAPSRVWLVSVLKPPERARASFTTVSLTFEIE